ncbi:MAG: peroxidase family protein [Planctomycetaceae bacterium]|nr:peroxidase family protein [Planctomycetaceae bacterium]
MARQPAVLVRLAVCAAALLLLHPDLSFGRPPGEGNVEPAEFRTIDGRNNNPDNPEWGAAGIPLLRRIPAAWPGDGSGETILQEPDRPNPRDISNLLVAQDTPATNRRQLTDMLWQWGQFLDHDIDLTLTTQDAGLAPIPVNDPNDPLAPSIPFVRSSFQEGTGTADSPRQQLNSITAFIDASNVYGSDEETAASLREFEGGRLRSSEGGLLLPTDDNGMFLAGDIRANEQVALLTMHTLFMREHNRLVGLLAVRNPTLTDEELYQKARRIVGAEMQIITYREYLPALLGWFAPSPWGSRRYRPDVDPSITTEFSTAAYRYGHSMLSPELVLVDEDSGETETLPLRDAFFNPGFLSSSPERVDQLLLGLTTQPAQELDVRIVDDVRNFLFGAPGAGGLDLASLNIQRGRDHGLPDYNSLREAWGLQRVTSFAEISTDEEIQTHLAELYDSVDSIDPWVGGLAEDHAHRGMSVGRLMAAIIRDQFERLRDGDRFYWIRDPGLRDPDIRGVINLYTRRLAEVIEDNTDLENVPLEVFSTERRDRQRGRQAGSGRNGRNGNRGRNAGRSGRGNPGGGRNGRGNQNGGR